MAASDFNTLNELFLQATEKHASRNCFLYKTRGAYCGLSSKEAVRMVAALAAVLDHLGTRAGDRVALLSENRLEWALTDYAILGRRAITVPIYPTLLDPDIEFILRDSEAKGIVVATDEQLRKVLNIRNKLPALKFILCMDCHAAAGTTASCWESSVACELAYRGHLILEPFRRDALAAQPGDTASILYTSGTTGQLKGVILTHANIVSNVRACLDLFPLSGRDVAMSFLPLCHVFERTMDFAYLSKGVSLAYAESLDALPQNLREVRPTVMAVVPRLLEKIHEKVQQTVRQLPFFKQRIFARAVRMGRQCTPYHLERRTLPVGLRLKHALANWLVFSRVRKQLGGRLTSLISGAAPLSADLAEFFWAVGLPVYEGYGLTETSPVISVNYPGHTKLGTVGQVIPGVEVKFGDESVDPEGRAGREILVRGPNVTPGYYHLDDENRAAFEEGWFHTGDLGSMDPQGYLTITGRKKNLFKTSGGKYVSPEKLENLFQGHPYIHQISVHGDGRKFICALIVPDFQCLMEYAWRRSMSYKNPAELVALPEIQAFMQQQVDEAMHWLPPHERIRQIVLLPKEFSIASGELSPSLKVKRRVVEEKYREEIEAMFLRPAPQAQPVPASK